MSTNVVLVAAIVVLVACGTTLVLERSLTRILVGFVMLGNGVNLVFLVASGPAGRAPIIGLGEGPMTDPPPQAMVLTAIVITLGVTAFGLALAYRAWQLTGHDDVQDDVEDRRIARLAATDERAVTDADTEVAAESLDEEAAEARDETDEGAPAREVHS